MNYDTQRFRGGIIEPTTLATYILPSTPHTLPYLPTLPILPHPPHSHTHTACLVPTAPSTSTSSTCADCPILPDATHTYSPQYYIQTHTHTVPTPPARHIHSFYIHPSIHTQISSIILHLLVA